MSAKQKRETEGEKKGGWAVINGSLNCPREIFAWA